MYNIKSIRNLLYLLLLEQNMVSLNIGTTEHWEQYMDAGGYSTAIYEHGLISIPCNCSLCIRIHLRRDGEQAWPYRGSLDYCTVYRRQVLCSRRLDISTSSYSRVGTRATRAICSRSLFFKEQRERIAHSRSLKWVILRKTVKSEWAKEL